MLEAVSLGPRVRTTGQDKCRGHVCEHSPLSVFPPPCPLQMQRGSFANEFYPNAPGELSGVPKPVVAISRFWAAVERTSEEARVVAGLPGEKAGWGTRRPAGQGCVKPA